LSSGAEKRPQQSQQQEQQPEPEACSHQAALSTNVIQFNPLKAVKTSASILGQLCKSLFTIFLARKMFRQCIDWTVLERYFYGIVQPATELCMYSISA